MAKTTVVKREIQTLEERTRSAESIMRFILTVQKDSLAKAERLRKLVLQLLNARSKFALQSQLDRLGEFAGTLLPFHKQVKMTPKQRKAYRKIMASG